MYTNKLQNIRYRIETALKFIDENNAKEADALLSHAFDQTQSLIADIKYHESIGKNYFDNETKMIGSDYAILKRRIKEFIQCNELTDWEMSQMADSLKVISNKHIEYIENKL